MPTGRAGGQKHAGWWAAGRARAPGAHLDQGAGVAALGSCLAEHSVLRRGEQLPPLRVGVAHLGGQGGGGGAEPVTSDEEEEDHKALGVVKEPISAYLSFPGAALGEGCLRPCGHQGQAGQRRF